MKMIVPLKPLLLLLATALSATSGIAAQSGHEHGSVTASTTAGSGSATEKPVSSQASPHAGMEQPQAPEEHLRDPHAYSGGYTLESGPYVLAGPRQLYMADEHPFSSLLVNRLERVHTKDDNSTHFSAQAWFGQNYNRLVIKTEGVYARDRFQDGRAEVLWSHAIASYWDTQLGVRHDFGSGPDRNWLAFGVQGITPYGFELDATAYLGSAGRSALKVEAEYELLITQRLILQPRAEVNFYGREDQAHGLGSGLGEALAGLRLRYEISRQFAPYLGVEWAGKFGKTGDFARAEDEVRRETRYVAGLRFWF